MSERSAHIVALMLAVLGALLITTSSFRNAWLNERASRSLPAFKSSTPNLPDWPKHAAWSPLG